MEKWNTEPAQSADTIAHLRERVANLTVLVSDVEDALSRALAERDTWKASVAELEAALPRAYERGRDDAANEVRDPDDLDAIRALTPPDDLGKGAADE